MIFVHTKSKELKYDGALERGEMQRHLFKKVLQFNDVTVHTDLTKAKIIEVLDSVKERAE